MLTLTAWILVGSMVTCFVVDSLDTLITSFTLARRNNMPMHLLTETFKEIARDALFKLVLGILVLPTIYMVAKFAYKTAYWLWTGRWTTTM